MKILVTEEISPKGLDLLRKNGFTADVRLKMPKEEFLKVLPPYEAIITRSGTPVDKEVLDAGTSLKIVARAGVGVDNVDINYATKKGIVVVNVPAGNTISAAEHTIGLLVGTCRNIPAASMNLKSGEWDRKKYMGAELNGKTLGIIGFGRVGSHVGKIALAFDMDLLVYDPYIPEKKVLDIGGERARLVKNLDELLRGSDVITVHTPLTGETRNILAKKEISGMKDGVKLINCARGGIINEKDWLDALNSGKVSGAGCDVWTEEPPESDWMRKLINHPMMVVTPHIGANTSEAQTKVGVTAAEQIIKFAQGDIPDTALNMAMFSPGLLEKLRGFIPLCEILGNFAIQLSDKNPDTLEVEYRGEIADVEDLSLLTSNVIKGIFSQISDMEINMVNAKLAAAEKGLMVKESKTDQSTTYKNKITVRLVSGGSSRTVAGTLFGEKPKIVGMRDFDVDFAPAGHILIASYPDRPGIIGKIGTLLGENNINIESMSLGNKSKIKEALVAFNLNREVPEKMQAEIAKAVGASFIKLVKV